MGSVRAQPAWPHDTGWTLSSDTDGSRKTLLPGHPGCRGSWAAACGTPWKGLARSPVAGEPAGPLAAQTGSAGPGCGPHGLSPQPGSPVARPQGAQGAQVACHLATSAGLHSAPSRAGTSCCFKGEALVDPITPKVSSPCCAEMTSSPRAFKAVSWCGRQWPRGPNFAPGTAAVM